jgi:hypothetical protein
MIKGRWGVSRFAHNFILDLIIAILLALGVATSLEAQTGSLRLEGIVWDSKGNALKSVQLIAVEENTGHQSTTVSDEYGYYRFLVLQPGIYTVTAKAKGLQDVIHRHISVYTRNGTSENFSFEANSRIDISISPSERAQLLDSDIAGSFTSREFKALPLLNRNPLGLLVFQPGVQIAGGNEDLSTINGARRAMNAIRMDGVSLTDSFNPTIQASLLPINPDSFSSLRIITTGSNAEFGGAGGAQITATSRSGDKKWSGGAYDFFRNKRLNASDYFSHSYGLSPPQLTRDMFGAFASGPIGKKSSLFVNFEGNRTDQELYRNRMVLTSIAKTGRFQWYAPDDIVRNSNTVKTFDIVVNDPRKLGINPTIALILAKMPDPNNFDIGDGLNTGGFRFKNPTYLQRERGDIRYDYELNTGHRLFMRFNMDYGDATDVADNADATFPAEKSGTSVNNNWGITIGSDFTLSWDKINEFRAGYQRTNVDLKRPARTAGSMLLANSWTNPLDPAFPSSSNSSFFEITDNFSHAMSLHTLKYGFTFRRTHMGSNDSSGIFPNITFGAGNGNVPSDAIGPSVLSVISEADRQILNNFYNDLLGRIESVSKTYYSSLTSALPAGTARKRSYASQEFDGFIQDTWRITPNITFNFGLRFELSTAPKETSGFQGVLDKASQISSTAHINDFKIIAGNRWYSSLKDFAPRAGVAWDIFGSGAMVLRSSYGIYYDRPIGAITRFIDKNSYGFAQTAPLYPNSLGTDVRLSDSYALPAQPAMQASQPPDTRASSIAVWDPNLKTPRVDQFNITLQTRFQKFMKGTILEASYVRTRGKQLFQYLNLNQTKTDGDFLQAFKELQANRDMAVPVPATNTLKRIFGSPLAAFNALGGSNFDNGEAGIVADLLDRNSYDKYAAAGVSDFYIRNFPQFNMFLFGTNAAQSWYDSLQIGIRKSNANYHFRAFYTWSKALDTISYDGVGYVSPSDSFHPEQDKAPSSFDRRHVMNITYDYALPIWRNLESDTDAPGYIRALFGGWNLGTIWTWESGAHFSITSGRQNRYAGVSALANFQGDRNIGHIVKSYGYVYWLYGDQQYQFSYPEAGQASNSGRNSFTGPRYFNVDAVIHKQFRISANKSLELRIEGYNVFNHVRFGLPNSNLFDRGESGNHSFGMISTTQGTPRMLQTALRLQF